MVYVLIEDGVVTQKQPNDQAGFVEVSDDVVCGMLFDGVDFTNPIHAPAPAESDPDADIYADISASTNFAELKSALLGDGPNGAKVRGKK